MQIPTGSTQEIEYFTFSYIHGSWLFILWLHCRFCNKKGTIRPFTGFGHLQTSETSGRNMTVELVHQQWKNLYLQKFPFSFLRSESNIHFPHPAFGGSGCRLSNSTVIFLPDVSDVWRWPNPVKGLIVPFILILKCSRYFICSESVKKMSIFAWYLVLISFIQEINAASHRLHSRNWIFYI
jgi:hypothetical protein